MKTTPEGLGIWIDQLDQCESGDLHKILERCKSSGIKWICIKSGEGSLTPGFDSAFIVIRELFHANGIKVYTWNYSKPSTWMREVSQIKFLVNAGVDGHILKAELEWQTVTDNKQEAINFLKELRTQVGDAFIGYSTFAIVNYHATFPYAQFSEFCDASFPQLFWTEFNWDIQKAISMTDSSWNLFAINNPLLKKPVCPVGGVYGNEAAGVQGTFKAMDLVKFLTHYEPSPVSLFSYDTASKIPNLTFDFLVARHGGFPLPIYQVTSEDFKPRRVVLYDSKPVVGHYDIAKPKSERTVGDYALNALKFLFHIQRK